MSTQIDRSANAKRLVKRKYPDARCGYSHNAISYDIYADSYKGNGQHGYGELGTGQTEAAAWRNAAWFVRRLIERGA